MPITICKECGKDVSSDLDKVLEAQERLLNRKVSYHTVHQVVHVGAGLHRFEIGSTWKEEVKEQGQTHDRT